MNIQDVYILGDKKIGPIQPAELHCPYLGYPIAMALVDADSVEIGDTVGADVRGNRLLGSRSDCTSAFIREKNNWETFLKGKEM